MQIKRNKNGFTICDFKIVEKYKYKDYTRNDEKIRTYNVDGQKFPSVTTILSATQSEEKMKALCLWRQRVGQEQATRITIDAARRGTEMHLVLEKYCQAIPYLNLTPQGNQSRMMAHRVVENLGKLKEVWGSEVHLFHPKIYAGTTDLVGVYKGKPAIMDFKQTNKPKKKEWVDDYYLQLTAYALAHNELYGTNIRSGHIFMCSRDFQYQQFDLLEEDFAQWESKWWDRVYLYYDKFA